MAKTCEIEGAFSARSPDASKYSVGTVAVVGGSARFPHAPVMAALGARAAGAGLVHLVVPPQSLPCAGALIPEATVCEAHAAGELPRADAVVVGPGLGQSPENRRLFQDVIVSLAGRLVVDADALGFLSDLGSVAMAPSAQDRILTPHEGEAARLLGCDRADVSRDRLAAAREIARRYSSTVVLKGPGTLIVPPDCGRAFQNPTGNPFMALGGMGDLLSGAVAARWAAGNVSAFVAAAAAAWLHGEAADRLVARSVMPTVAAVSDEMGSVRVGLERDAAFVETV